MRQAAWYWVTLVALGGCAEQHGRDDASASIDAGPVYRDCAELLAAPDGALCEDPSPLRCLEWLNAFCSSHEATCVDGRVSHQRDVWVLYRDEDPRTCMEGMFDVRVDGAETRSFDRGAASTEAGFTNSTDLLLASGAAFYDCPRPSLYVTFRPAMATFTYDGVLDASGQLVVEGEAEPRTLTGTVDVSTDAATGQMVGTISLTGDGLAATGSFSVVPCDALGRTSI
ncbi:MAG: hypothetical protein AB7S26_38580 [Sandaracinaceae bacterium]